MDTNTKTNSNLEIATEGLSTIQSMSSESEYKDQDTKNSATATTDDKIPSIVLSKVLKKITKKSLLECRLVCSKWKTTINNDSKIMKSLTFNVVDAQEFLDSSDLSTKVKSIRFDRPLLKNSEECLEKFFTVIGKTVEHVTFDFGKLSGNRKELSEARKRQKLMFSMVLQHCTKMTELTIGSKNNTNCNFIKGCGEDPKHSVVLSLIQHLSVNARSEYLADAGQLLLQLPNLRCINLVADYSIQNDDDEDDVDDTAEGEEEEHGHDVAEKEEVKEDKVVTELAPWIDGKDDKKANSSKWTDQFGNNYNFPNKPMPKKGPFELILDHLQKFNGNLQEVFVDDPIDHHSYAHPEIKFFLSVGKLYPNTIIKNKPRLNFLKHLCFEHGGHGNDGLEIDETTCSAIRSGNIQLFGDSQDYNRIGFCTNLQSLDIEIHVDRYSKQDRIHSDKLAFIQPLNKLTYLKVKDESGKLKDGRPDRLSSGEVFSFGIPSLTTLDFNGEGLGLNSLEFHTCFPNLAKLYVRNYSGELNEDFIYELTKLDKLRKLTLEKIVNLSDGHLTTKVYEFIGREDKQMETVPAIARIKNLTCLHIVGCNRLTDDCLVNGLALCKKLQKITLCYVKGQGKFTSVGLNSLQQEGGGKYIVQDLSDSHGKKKHSKFPRDK